MRHGRLPLLDLFSGIGGFSFALKSCCKTVAYCEIELACQQVLRQSMKKGYIDHAPVFGDVKTLNPADISSKPVVITAGSPCQDISVLNPTGQGLDGAKSGLLWEVLRLSGMMPSVKYIFLENSPLLESRGFCGLCKTFRKQGFRCVWGVFRASDVGALHERRRFFCLAFKQPLCLPMKQFLLNAKEPCCRLVKSHKQAVVRGALLGNSVVPQQVVLAWNTLCKFTDSKEWVTEVQMRPPQPRSVDIQLVQGATVFTRDSWPTPTKCNSQCQYRTLTERSTRVLSNAIAFDKQTQAQHKPGGFLLDRWHVNPCFVEWLMGYPEGYTHINADEGFPSHRPGSHSTRVK